MFFNQFFSGAGGGGQNFHFEDHESQADTTHLYEVLGIKKDASQGEVKKAFHKLAKKAHPDKGGDQVKFKEINAAYEILSDPEKRRLYDKFGLEGVQGGSNSHSGDIFDIFNMFGGGGFGGSERQRKVQKNKATKKELKVTLEDSYLGGLMKQAHTCIRVCKTCDGKGGKNASICSECKGHGRIEKMVMLGPGMYQQVRGECSKCNGQGRIISEKEKCKKCNGDRVQTVNKTLEIPLEKGTPERWIINLPGEGDELPDIMAGDVNVIVLFEKHKIFERRGADLFIKKEISLIEALSGTRFEITHLDGQKILVSTSKGEIIGHKEKKIIKGKGMPFFKNEFHFGNLIIEFDVKFPKKGELSMEDCEILQKVLPGNPGKIPSDYKNYEILEDFDENNFNTNEEGGRKPQDEEEEQEGPGGVQCHQQ